jgi:hypothetical protein
MTGTETPRLICTFALFVMLIGGAMHSAYVKAPAGPYALTLENLINGTFSARSSAKYAGTYETLAQCQYKGQLLAGLPPESGRIFRCTPTDPSRPVQPSP